MSALRSASADERLEQLEEFGAGIGLAAVLCWASEFLPFWAAFVALGASAWAALSLGKDFFPTAVRTTATLLAVFIAASQPWAAFVVSFAAAIGAAWLLFDRGRAKWTCLLAGAGTLVVSMAFYVLLVAMILPALHPLTVVFYNSGPLIAVVSGVVISGYCAWRASGDADDRLFYKLAPGVGAALFALFYPMKNSWLGLGAEWLFVVAAFVVAFRGSRPLLVAGTALGGVFAAVFLLMNGSTFMHDVAMAESMNVHEVSRLPTTINNRIMPVVVGRDFCVQGNDSTMTDTGEPHALIVSGKFYWQCPTHYTGFQLDHPLSWIPGSTAGFVLVNAGTTASDTRLNLHGFLFGENSKLVKAAFEARHPNGTIAGFTYAADSAGNYHLLVPYTTNQLYWGAMVPTLGGVMVVSPWGFVEDYTVAQASVAFPGTFLYPPELARQYAEVWGKRTIGKVINREFLEVSESSNQSSLANPYPYGIDTEEGRKYFIPYEPQGKNGTAMSDVAFFDGASGDSDVSILHLADHDTASSDTALGHRSIQGPKELLEKSANVIQGHFQLTSIEPIIVVSKEGRLYFITANMGPDKTKSNHDYQGDTLSFATGEPQWVITSTDDVNKHIQDNEMSLDGASAPAAAPVAAPTPAHSDTAPALPPSVVAPAAPPPQLPSTAPTNGPTAP